MIVRMFDLETSSLEGGFGRIHCASFVDLDSDEVITYRRDRLKYKGKKKSDDGKLAVAIRNYLEDADIIVSWNGIMFDVPMLNARLMHAGERGLLVGEKYASTHLDLMYYARPPVARPGSSKLERVQQFLKLDEEKTPLTPETWADASAGSKEAMNSIVEHCEQDVRVLKEVFLRLAPFVKKVQFSLAEVHPFITEIPSRKGKH